MDILISIKPKYAKKIVSGEKKFEYRKKIFKQAVDKIFIYSSSPQKKIIGHFEYSGYLKGTPNEIWNETKISAGIAEAEYKKYFQSKILAYALKIKNCVIYKKPIDPYSKINNFRAPQSYMYIQEQSFL